MTPQPMRGCKGCRFGRPHDLDKAQRCFSDFQQGFSFLDILIVVLILGIIGAVGFPRLHAMIGEAKLNEAAAELVGGLHYAANLAILHQRPFGVKTNVGNNWFRVYDARFQTDPNPPGDSVPLVGPFGVVINPVDKKWYAVDFDTLSSTESVQLVTAPAGSVVLFYPDGHSGATASVFVLRRGNDQKTVTVNGITGKVTVQ